MLSEGSVLHGRDGVAEQNKALHIYSNQEQETKDPEEPFKDYF